jgi:hypothetical protein
MTVYLAGPIDGCSRKEASQWRSEAAQKLDDAGIWTIDPTMNLPFNMICDTDRLYLKNSDLMLLNMQNEKGHSYGSMIEVGWADMMRIPIILVVSKPEDCTHQMLQRIVMQTRYSLDEAIDDILFMRGII